MNDDKGWTGIRQTKKGIPLSHRIASHNGKEHLPICITDREKKNLHEVHLQMSEKRSTCGRWLLFLGMLLKLLNY